MRKLIFALLYLVFGGLSVLVLLGFANSLHPLFDSLSDFRFHLMILLAIVGFFLVLMHSGIYRVFHLVFLLGVSAYLYLLNLPYMPEHIDKHSKHSFTHMQFNINFRNKQMDKLKQYITDNEMDIITLQEVTPGQMHSLQTLKTNGVYPYQIYCKFRPVGGGAILSKYPIEHAKAVCALGLGMLTAPVKIEDTTISVTSLHLYWPYPYSQQKQIGILKGVLSKLDKPTLISGDFNAVSWSDAAKKVARYSNTKIVGGMRWSMVLKDQLPNLPFIKLPIDQLLVSDILQVESIEVKEDLGSDHLPIVAKIWYWYGNAAIGRLHRY